MTDADWLAAVAAAPDDPLVRLVYADWLDDQGDARGEQLRLDVTLAGLADDDPAAEPLRRRLAELVPGTDARWRAAACRVPISLGGWEDDRACMCALPGDAPVAGLIQYDFPGYHGLAREPADRGELQAMVIASLGCRSQALRYTGDDPVIIQMLGNDPAYCHFVIPTEAPTLKRVDPSPVPRWQDEIEAAYQPFDVPQRTAFGRFRDRISDILGLVAVAILILFFGLAVLSLLLQGVLALIG